MDKIKIPFSEFHFTYSRGQGPGGQNVNKVNTKVTLHWPWLQSQSCPVEVMDRFKQKYQRFVVDEEIQVTSQEHRSQRDNQQECITKLHRMLNSVAVAPKKRKATKPKRSAVLKRLSSKRKEGEVKRLRQKVSS
jgi:ribosome-associated protein